MTKSRLQLRKLTERAMRGGSMPLALLLEVLIPVAAMRVLAKELGLQPKGGFRLEKAPAKVMAELLAEQQNAEHVDKVMELFVTARSATVPLAPANKGARSSKKAVSQAGGPAQGDAPQSKAEAVSPIARLKEQELRQVREELERARLGKVRAGERETELRNSVERLTAQVQLLRSDLEACMQSADGNAPVQDDRRLLHRIHDLEQELAGFVEADEGLRRQLALERTRIRELEDEIKELLPLVPKGRRKKRPAPEPPSPDPARRFLLPYFGPSFYRSLEGKDRKSVERAFHAISLFCTEGHAYPGLEVKQLGGQDTWSLRASLGLRVYFRQRPDGDVLFLELADREEQRTTLRRLKDR